MGDMRWKLSLLSLVVWYCWLGWLFTNFMFVFVFLVTFKMPQMHRHRSLLKGVLTNSQCFVIKFSLVFLIM